MAAITSTNVVVTRAWDEGDRGGKVIQSVKQLIITLSAQGGTAADIPASALGFAEVYECYAYGLNVSGTMKGALTAIAIDGSEIFPIDVNQATDANRTLRANVTGDLYVTVKGRSAA